MAHNPFQRKRSDPGVPRETAPARPMFVGRPQFTGNWVPGMVTHPMHVRTWVPHYGGLGAAISTVSAGRWARGGIFRFIAPDITPPAIGYFMYDPTRITLVPGTPERPIVR